MSVIGYREWQTWTNSDFFSNESEISGIVHLKITPSLMAEQTIGFIYERIGSQYDNEKLLTYFNACYITPTNELVIQKFANITTNYKSVLSFIKDTMLELEAISLCLDFPLNCNEVHFHTIPVQQRHGDVFIASRKSIGRGLGFEVEERGLAARRLDEDFEKILDEDPVQRVATRHYLNGLTLLGLEDQFSGLIDAAFMQFYQACEVLCGENYKLIEVKKYIASNYPSYSNELQIIAHHIWQIRNNYFGHGNVIQNINNSSSSTETFNIAKQVLVVRWLCKKLLDLKTTSHELVREMILYHNNIGHSFDGSTATLAEKFYTGYDYKTVDIVDGNGTKLHKVDISNNTQIP